MKLKKSAHAVYKTQYHIVWIMRFRRKILVKGLRKYYPEWEYIAIGIDVDHVHRVFALGLLSLSGISLLLLECVVENTAWHSRPFYFFRYASNISFFLSPEGGILEGYSKQSDTLIITKVNLWILIRRFFSSMRGRGSTDLTVTGLVISSAPLTLDSTWQENITVPI